MRTIVLTQKNPKTSSSLFNHNVVEVIEKGETKPFAYIVNAKRTSYNRYGGCNTWEVFYITVLNDNIDILPLDEDSQYLRDIQLYLPELNLHRLPCTYFHMGARNGMEPRYAFFDTKEFKLVDFCFHVVKTTSGFKEAMKNKSFSTMPWDGKEVPIIEKDLYLSSDVVVLRTDNGIHYISEEFSNSIYNSEEYKEIDIEVLKRNFVNFLERTNEEIEAPSEDEEPHVMRVRRHRRSEEE